MKSSDLITIPAGGFAILVIGVTLFIYEAFFVSMHVTYDMNEMRDVEGNPKEVFKPGEPIFMSRKICKDRDVLGMVDREIVNVGTGAVYPITRVPTGVFIGCEQRTVSLPVPPNLPEGHYLFKSRGLYHINSFRSYATVAPPIPFEIKK